jgi:hypothetical protein
LGRSCRSKDDIHATLKIYAGTGRPVGRKVIEEGHRRGLIVTGHLSAYTAQDAVVDGIDCLEHIWSVFDFSIPPEIKKQPDHRSTRQRECRAKPKDRLYARKHVPWVSFENVPNGATVDTSSNLRFADFPTDPAKFDTLRTVAIVVPNLVNDMHNGEPDQSIPKG